MATLAGSLLAAIAADPPAAPCTGDWLVLRTRADGRVTGEAVLPRRTALVRAVATPGVAKARFLPPTRTPSPSLRVRADGKGRHTTAYRELVQLPSGGMVIDTPGLRGIGLWDAGRVVERVFSDIEDLAAACRFADCSHGAEPGCAVTAALESGQLPERRWASYRKLQREAAWIAARQNARVRAAQVKAVKRIQADLRRSGRSRP